jgi:hypothetical protein
MALRDQNGGPVAAYREQTVEIAHRDAIKTCASHKLASRAENPKKGNPASVRHRGHS